MFRFEHIEYLWLLLALIPFAALFVWFMLWRKKSLSQFANSALLPQLAAEASRGKLITKFVLLSLAYVFVILGFANPQIGTKQEKIKREGIDVIIALDVSNSMLAEDVKPNRLMRAKNFISNFIDELHNDRLGMIVFAGRAYLQMPLTVDYSAGRMYLKSINTNMVPSQGTAIGEAVNLARESFAKGENKSKALIILSDGEDNEDGADDAIEAAAKEGVKVFTIGVGSENGGPIPFGTDFKRDEENNIVLTKLNQAMLKGMADKGNGKFFMLGSGKEEIASIFKELGRIHTKEFEEMVFTDFDDQFQWCLLIAALLLMVEWWLNERKLNMKIFGFLLLFSVGNQPSSNAQINTPLTPIERKETRNGNKEYEKGSYADAEAGYKRALEKKNNMPEAVFNLGDAIYQQQRYDTAIKHYQLSAQTNPDPLVKAQALHNMGNAYLSEKKYQEAITSFKTSLKINPLDQETKYNLAYANAMLRKQQEQEKKDKENKDKQDKNQQQKDQQAQPKDGQDKQQQKQPQQAKLSKEEAEKLLQALANEEQKTNQKMQQKQAKPVQGKNQKDW